MADKDLEKGEEATEMASQEGMEEGLGEETPLPSRERALTPSSGEAEWVEEDRTPSYYREVRTGSLRDRVAAGILDVFVLGYLYWGSLFAYNYFVWREFLRPFAFKGNHAVIFHLIFATVAFLYFFISEGVFFTSIGKFFCRLSVRNTEGGPASLFSIAMRNLLRPIDMALLFFPTWIFLEKTRKHQRLGDLLAGTVVMKHLGSPPSHLKVRGKTASATARATMGLIDFTFLAGWLGGFALWIDYQRPMLSLLIALALPLLYLLWQLIWDALFQTSLGQWLFGCRLAKEDGTPLHCSEATIRAIFKPSDLLAYGTLLLSNRNQTASDAAAGVVVIHAKRSWGPWVGILVFICLILGIWFFGMDNPRNFLNPGFRIDFLPNVFQVQVGGYKKRPPPEEPKGLFIKRFSYLLADRTTPRGSAEFQPGETIYFSIDITGFALRGSETWIQEDLMIRYPDNKIGFRKENIVDFHQNLRNPTEPLEIINTLSLPTDAEPGHYTLIIALHDRFANRHLTEQRTFRVVAE